MSGRKSESTRVGGADRTASGELLRRLPAKFRERRPRLVVSLLTTDDDLAVHIAGRREQDIETMIELRRWLVSQGCQDNWFAMAYVLAREVIPALQDASGKRGRAKRWGIDAQLELVMAVRALIHFKIAMSTKAACRTLEAVESQKYRTTELYRRHREALTQPGIKALLEKMDAYDRDVTGDAKSAELLLWSYLPSTFRESMEPKVGTRRRRCEMSAINSRTATAIQRPATI